ncbi:MBL fold metallo-hydrolase [Goodfellowiella coeruleoviolacea]|uniref:Cyclase n=1 Tax=Goodfellowiella coeruleoviolacea TaxID=334858 RepID=A0AAE3GIZ0_9PSEU|nr:MBL fold metallo-hydrolase [Goodfellowiella coeruleoviolacea]MCP2169030.1 cyclase [Goodfellowiella coeruleoviolacea]
MNESAESTGTTPRTKTPTASPAAAAAATTPPGRAEQVGDHSWAYVQQPGTWFINNAGFVAGDSPGDGGAVLIDTCATNRRTRALLDTATGLVGPLRAAVSTHHHGDHTYGNHLLPAGLPIWASAPAVAEAQATGIQHYQGVFQQPDWGDQQLRLATDVVEPAGSTVGRVLARAFGATAHTRGDVVGWVPDDGVLYTGDLVFAGVIPLALSGSVRGWLEALEWLRGFAAAVVVPGHGPVSHTPNTAIDAMAGYLGLVLRVAEDALARGRSAVDAAADLASGPYADWGDRDERNLINLTVAMAELRGEPVDVAALLAAALANNGGPLPCLA